jgi:hypothetical protein
MPTPTYTALATRTLTGTASSVVFSTIPATYRDLILVCSGTSSNTAINSIFLRFNSDTGSNYAYVAMYGISGGAGSGATTLTGAVAGLTISSSVNANITQIMDYSATDKHKTVLSRQNSLGDSFVRASTSRWANTAAITSITCVIDTGANFNSGSTFSLYGIIS